LAESSNRLIVLCGSLYLVGYFLKQNRLDIKEYSAKSDG
jgi:folylpolyglutamate synthase/dihydropteroate synthase